MPNTASPEYARAVQSLSAEKPVTLLTINHPDLAEPLRFNDTSKTVTSRGDEFMPWAFQVIPPSDLEDSVSTAQLSMDNVSRELVEWLELTNGGQGTEILLEIVLFGTPDTVEWEFNMALSNISISMTTLTGYLAFPDLVNLPACGVRYDIRTAKGLF